MLKIWLINSWLLKLQKHSYMFFLVFGWWVQSNHFQHCLCGRSTNAHCRSLSKKETNLVFHIVLLLYPTKSQVENSIPSPLDAWGNSIRSSKWLPISWRKWIPLAGRRGRSSLPCSISRRCRQFRPAAAYPYTTICPQSSPPRPLPLSMTAFPTPGVATPLPSHSLGAPCCAWRKWPSSAPPTPLGRCSRSPRLAPPRLPSALALQSTLPPSAPPARLTHPSLKPLPSGPARTFAAAPRSGGSRQTDNGWGRTAGDGKEVMGVSSKVQTTGWEAVVRRWVVEPFPSWWGVTVGKLIVECFTGMFMSKPSSQEGVQLALFELACLKWIWSCQAEVAFILRLGPGRKRCKCFFSQ